MDKNIHILSLRYGYEHQTGFNYKDLKELLVNIHKIEFTFELEFAFRIWFSQAFFNPNVEDDVNHRKLNPSSGFNNLYRNNLLPFDNSTNNIEGTTSFITGDSIIQYLDYLELKEARSNSITAKKYASVSIVIACLAIVIPIISAFFFPPSVQIIKPHDTKFEIKSESSEGKLLIEYTKTIEEKVKISDTTILETSQDSLSLKIN
ncbi:hypothetical protein MNBD_BACTEROID06-1681 [hydrothermal vent metagenome]|uniref:Uncharacterized protein n=1 Tax=hydrothermal vent metagenome TaxID=652676 RepID=A0A3B0UML7_9ZZZZ